MISEQMSEETKRHNAAITADALRLASAAIAPGQGETPGVAAVAAWFDVLEAAQDALHNVQYPLRAMELPPYPAGGTCGIANLGVALDHIVAAQKALDLVRDQLRHWQAMTAAYGPSSNTEFCQPHREPTQPKE